MAFVRIKHPDIKETGSVSERAYLRVYKEKGWELADTQPAHPANVDPDEPKRPQRNDSTDAWRTYAVTRGMTREDADELSRDELVTHFDTLDQTQES